MVDDKQTVGYIFLKQSDSILGRTRGKESRLLKNLLA
jgi:hypothetical protein